MKTTALSLHFITGLLMLLSGFSSFAYDFKVGDLYYNILSMNDKTVEVTYNDFSFGANQQLEEVTIPSEITYNTKTYRVVSIGKSAFINCYQLSSVIIPNSITTIGENAFGQCSLNHVDIPNSVTSIEKFAFSNCVYLTDVSIGNSVESIGTGAFQRCKKLISVTLGNSVKSIGDHAFQSCESLTSITIGNSLKSIGFAAFHECDKLASIYCLATTPTTANEYLFSESTYNEGILYVPSGYKSIYESTKPWYKFANIEEMDFSGVCELPEDADEPQITIENGTLRIEGIESSEPVVIYSIRGYMVYNGEAEAIPTLSRGIYIVKVRKLTAKFAI